MFLSDGEETCSEGQDAESISEGFCCIPHCAHRGTLSSFYFIFILFYFIFSHCHPESHLFIQRGEQQEVSKPAILVLRPRQTTPAG